MNEVDYYLGFPNDQIVSSYYFKNSTNKFSDIDLFKLGIFLAMSDNADYHAEARKILVSLNAKHDRSAPYMLLKWITLIQSGRDTDGNLEKMIGDWAKEYPDNLTYARTILWLKMRSADNIEIIGAFVKHLEIFWRDDLCWYKLGQFYDKEKYFDRAAFAYEEAVAINPQRPEYLIGAAASRLQIKNVSTTEQEENRTIALKQLSKALMIDDQNASAWQILIDNTNDQAKKAKYIAYRTRVTKSKTE